MIIKYAVLNRLVGLAKIVMNHRCSLGRGGSFFGCIPISVHLGHGLIGRGVFNASQIVQTDFTSSSRSAVQTILDILGIILSACGWTK